MARNLTWYGDSRAAALCAYTMMSREEGVYSSEEPGYYPYHQLQTLPDEPRYEGLQLETFGYPSPSRQEWTPPGSQLGPTLPSIFTNFPQLTTPEATSRDFGHVLWNDHPRDTNYYPMPDTDATSPSRRNPRRKELFADASSSSISESMNNWATQSDPSQQTLPSFSSQFGGLPHPHDMGTQSTSSGYGTVSPSQLASSSTSKRKRDVSLEPSYAAFEPDAGSSHADQYLTSDNEVGQVLLNSDLGSQTPGKWHFII